ncbi:ABC transporter ATP-binding protein [Bacillaceae bacterium Marseille-Q3522]|nr:ABC transporter ATP-binding protein [Bacillaceae bacterium Marseille-Q3522]
MIDTFYYKNKALFFSSIILVMIAQCLSLGSAYLLQILLDAANGNDITKLVHILILAAGFFIALFIIQMLLKKARCAFVKRAMIQYKEKAFDEITKKNISSFVRENTSNYLSVLTNDATSIENNYLYGTFKIISMCTSFIGAVLLMLWYNWIMTIVVLVLCVLPIAMYFLIGEKMVNMEKGISNKNEKFVRAMKDLLGGFAVIKSFQAEKQAMKLFQKENDALEDLKYKRKNTEGTINIISGEIGFFLQVGVFLFGAYLSIKGFITAGVVIAFVQLMNNVMDPIQNLPTLMANKKAAKALIDKFTIYASNNVVEDGQEVIDNIGAGITFQKVFFAYKDDNHVLKDIHLTIDTGKSYAIVGGSGSGKSTLLSLLLGSYVNYKGQIHIGDKELRSIKNDCLSNLISIVQQNVFIFDSTILDNITMFKEFDNELIKHVVRLSGLEKLIQEKGYNYQCGENGVKLSGGERQRISIARCLLKNTAVLLMDEATAALDAETGNNVLSQILEIEGLTRIVITHNLEESILRRFDEIFVLRNGIVVEQGSFAELIDLKKYFYSLFNVTGEGKERLKKEN